MCAFHSTAPDIERRRDPFVDVQSFRSDGGTHNVDHCIHRTDLVKVNLLYLGFVPPGFNRTQPLTKSGALLVRARAGPRARHDALTFSQSSTPSEAAPPSSAVPSR